MARSAKGNEVPFGIIAGLTAKLLVVDFKVWHHSTPLTPPGIATQNLLPQLFVGTGTQPLARRTGPR